MTRSEPGERPRKGVQLGIAALLVLTVVGLVGWIIWFNFEKTASLTVATAERLLAESSDDAVRRVELFYEPVVAIVALASRVPQISEMTTRERDDRIALAISGLRRYPQLFSIHVGYENGDFDMISRVGGDERSAVRKTLGAPDSSFFAHEVIRTESDGARRASWTFLDESGAPIDERAPVDTAYDPRLRQWYGLALGDGKVHRSDPYVFASSQEIGITLSRKLDGPSSGVLGADLALREISSFLAKKKISPSTVAFLFNGRGEIIVYPDDSKIQRAIKNERESTLVPTTIASLGDPVISALYAAAQKPGSHRMMRLDVDGRAYLSRVARVMEQFGETDYLGMVVPVDEITGPIDRIRSEALVYSVVVLLLVLPVYVTLVFVWLDHRLGRRSLSLSDIRGIDTADLE